MWVNESRSGADGKAARADRFQPGTGTGRRRRFRVARKTLADQVWRARGARVWAARGWHTPVTAASEVTGEVKFFVTDAIRESVGRVLAVGFRRATVEHAFRVAKPEAGLMPYEGRDYTGLIRHLTPSLIVLGFVAAHAERLRAKNPRVTQEPACRALNVRRAGLLRRRRGVGVIRHTSEVIGYHQRRNAQAAKSHKKQGPASVT